MGCPAGGSMANTYLLKWEQTFTEDITFKPYLLCYTRYFDDGFFIWTGPNETLQKLLTCINNIDPAIKTTHSTGKSIQFLDIQITIDANNNLLTRPFRKSTASTQFLHYKSNHPNHIKTNLPFSLIYRNFLISSNTATFHSANILTAKLFHNSGYPQAIFTNQLDKFLTKYNIKELEENDNT
jgi:hypothetical protein